MTGTELPRILVGAERTGWVAIDPAAGRGAYFPDPGAALVYAQLQPAPAELGAVVPDRS